MFSAAYVNDLLEKISGLQNELEETIQVKNIYLETIIYLMENNLS